MSLDRLPTEIDEQIVAHLQHDCDQRALNALSRASRSCYRVASSALYRDIVVHTNECWRWIYLLRTLLECPEHALLIRSIQYTKSTTPIHTSAGTDATDSPALGDLISHENRDALKRLVNVHTINQIDTSFAKVMYDHIITSNEGSYGVLALILSISVNVETIILTPRSDVKLEEYSCMATLEGHWKYVQDLLYFFRLVDPDIEILNRKVHQHAFSKLRMLTICADGAASAVTCIPPCLETLHISWSSSALFFQLDPLRNNLRTVHLEHGFVAQDFFIGSLKDGELLRIRPCVFLLTFQGVFIHVQTLHIKYISRWFEGILGFDELFETRILEAIQDHVPDLRAFEWVGTPLQPLEKDAFSLESFKNLEHLVLDCERLE